MEIFKRVRYNRECGEALVNIGEILSKRVQKARVYQASWQQKQTAVTNPAERELPEYAKTPPL